MYSDLLKAAYELGADGPTKYDCFTLAREVLRRNDIYIPRWASIADDILKDKAINEGKNSFTKINKPEPFCVVVILHRSGILASHIGVVLECTTKFIHITPKMVAIERLDRWRKRIDGYYKYNT